MIDMESSGLFEGWIRYHAMSAPSEDICRQLSGILEEAGLTEECENGRLPISWNFNNADGPPFNTRELVFMWVDGGDAFYPGVLFYRRTYQGTNAGPMVHIPPVESQGMLEEASWWAEGHEPKKIQTRLATLNSYIASVINNPDAWQALASKPRWLPYGSTARAESRMIDDEE